MRMHSYGKWSGNVGAGVGVVFSLILLYNYWTVSAQNKDLLRKIHGLETQLISL
jgi:hypothetical protein